MVEVGITNYKSMSEFNTEVIKYFMKILKLKTKSGIPT